MSDQPKPKDNTGCFGLIPDAPEPKASGEWTVEYLMNDLCRYWPRSEGLCAKIADAHNAALAAAYKRGADFARQCCADEENEDLLRLEKQLAAEREKCGSHGGKASRGWADKDHIQKTFEADQLHEQLAAEREAWITNGLNAVAGKEREIAALDHEIQQLREQLAAAQATIKKAHFRFRPPPGDTTALDAVIAAARKPLMDALEKLTKSVDALEGQEIEYSLGIKLAKDCMSAKAALVKAGQ